MSNEPGPTGRYPYGKLDDEDEGELNVAVYVENGKVRIDFGTKLDWLAFTPDDALGFAKLLAKMAAIASIRPYEGEK